MNEEELLKKLQEAFQAEAAERLQSLSEAILSIERGPAAEQLAAILDKAFREAHSLKGAARSINLTEIESLFQALESLFAAVKRGAVSFSQQLFDLLHATLAGTESYLEKSRVNALDADGLAVLTELADRLNEAAAAQVRSEPAVLAPAEEEREEEIECEPRILATEVDASCDVQSVAPCTQLPQETTVAAARKSTTVQRTAALDSVRISSARLDRLLLKTEELLSLKLNAARQVKDLKNFQAALEEQKRRTAPAAESGAYGGRRFGAAAADGLIKELQQLIRQAEQDNRMLRLLIDDLVSDMKEILLLPFSTVLNIFPRMIRDIAREAGKEAVLEVVGGEIEIDKRILEEIKDPLIHLLRNAVDHGIEAPDQRERSGKPRQGTIEVAVSSVEGNRVEILLRDDGRGIPTETVKEKAVRLGLVSEEAARRLDEEEALRLVFLSGVSTSPMVTEISGRGLGLAIVHDTVEALGGRLTVKTERGQGSRFKIVLPVTLATFRGVLVMAGGRPFILPCAQVQRTVRIAQERVRTVENRPAVSIAGKTLPLLGLSAILGLPAAASSDATQQAFVVAVVLEAGGEQMAFQVDEVLGEEEVLVKGLGRQLKRVRNIAGAAVLGTGEVAPVLNVRDLFQTAVEERVRPTVTPVAGERQLVQKSILVAEDSITSRVLLKSILEGAGYRVKTAVDGMEAFSLLKTEPFDLLVSDVEMPRLDGFELTGRVRADKELADIPVVLVTGLESAEHREKGIMVGASAYLTKSGFEQGNLIEVVRRLI